MVHPFRMLPPPFCFARFRAEHPCFHPVWLDEPLTAFTAQAIRVLAVIFIGREVACQTISSAKCGNRILCHPDFIRYLCISHSVFSCGYNPTSLFFRHFKTPPTSQPQQETKLEVFIEIILFSERKYATITTVTTLYISYYICLTLSLRHLFEWIMLKCKLYYPSDYNIHNLLHPSLQLSGTVLIYLIQKHESSIEFKFNIARFSPSFKPNSFIDLFISSTASQYLDRHT